MFKVRIYKICNVKGTEHSPENILNPTFLEPGTEFNELKRFLNYLPSVQNLTADSKILMKL